MYFLALAACSALTSTPREGTKLAKGVSTISWGGGGGGGGKRRKGGGGGIQEREGLREGLRDGKGRRKKGRRERQWRGRVGGEIRREGGRRREEEK